MGPEVAVPVGTFVMVVAIVWVAMAYASRNRAAFLDTVRAAIERGTELSPELIRALGAPRGARYSDIKWGCIWIGVAAACITFGWALGSVEPEEELFYIFLGIAAFPGFVGIALLGYGIATLWSHE